MRSMKGLSMNKVFGKIQRRPTGGISAGSSQPITEPQINLEGSPEEVVVRAVRKFCESSGPSSASGDEVILLPTIVEAVESSPAAASEAARTLRKFLNKDNNSSPSRQYNAIMIFRILADNPGPRFTRYIDKKFVDTTKELLRSGRDPSVLNLLWETLDSVGNTASEDTGLKLLLEMWTKEKERSGFLGARSYNTGPRVLNAPPHPDQGYSQNYWAKHHRNKHLPDIVELTNRLEEARTSAKLLEQTVACTPPQEVLSNELIREFADRCQSASRSIQVYMVSDSPPPDNDMMECLIDTNEQLQASLNQHQRAVLGARKAMGIGAPDSTSSPALSHQERPSNNKAHSSGATYQPLSLVGSGDAASGLNFGAPGANSGHSPLPARTDRDDGRGKAAIATSPPPPLGTGPSTTNTPNVVEDPFRDPTEPYHPSFGSERSNGKQPARPSDQYDDDDDIYEGSHLKKDPSDTMLRY